MTTRHGNGDAAITGEAEIFVMNADGSGQTRLTLNAADDMDPTWSPDGAKIAFDSARDGDIEIYVMNGDGTAQTRLTAAPGPDFAPAWSSDGAKIVFVSTRDGTGEIYVMNADGSAQTRLTNNGSDDQYPVWSPDGTKIAFTSNRDGDDEIFVMNTDGSGQTQLTSNGGDDYHPDWSPDSKKIVFASDRDAITLLGTTVVAPEIYTMNADGSGQSRVTINTDYDEEPVWSPDGTKLIYSSHNGTLQAEILSLDLVTLVTANLSLEAGLDFTPDWQPVQAPPSLL